METSNSNQGANPNVYEYLVEQYGDSGAKINILDNGGYYVTDIPSDNGSHTNNEIYIPPTVGSSSSVSMISYYPGGGGIENDAVQWKNKILSENPPDAIITLSSTAHQSTDIMEFGYNIANDNGSNVTNVVLGTYSASGNCCTRLMDAFVGNHPDITSTLVIADGSIDRNFVGQNMIDNQTQIVVISGEHGMYWHNEIKYSIGQLKKLGYNVNILQTVHNYDENKGVDVDNNSHYFSNYDSIKGGIHEYILGISDEINPDIMDICDYKLYSYENGDYVLIDNGKDFSSIRQENETYGYALERLTKNPFDEGTVASDMYSVVSSLNGIRHSMASNEIITPTYSSTSTIPGNLMNAESSLLGISGDLNNTIYRETQVISSIAQVFYDMDRERTNAANALSDGRELLFDESAYTDALNQLISVDISSQLSFESFMFNPFSHTEGNSGKICLSDLTSMLNGSSLAGPLHENLDNEKQSAKAIQQELNNLNSMISSGTNFQGDIWKKVSQRLTDYSDLMDLRIESADKLESAIAKAIKLIVDYMGDYEELDDSKLPELKESAEKAKKNILDAQNIVNATHTVTKTYEDEDGYTKYYYVTEYVYSASARSEARAYISTTTALLKEINEEINKLENLPIVLAEAEQIVNDALTEIYGNYGVKVSSAVTGKTVSYIPPENTNYVAPAYSRVELFNPKPIVEGKVDQGSYYMSSELQGQYGSYEDYLNGVLRVNNPMYNSEMEDNGIEPGQSLDDKIFDREDDDVLDDTTSTSDIDEDNGTTNVVSPNPVNPSPSPSEPVVPDTPREPVEPDTPREPVEPDTPSDPVVPDTPSDPVEPETPSEPVEPETPSEPVEPETPSEPVEPETPIDPIQTYTPSDPVKPDTPSNPTQPESPNVSIQPDTPSDPVIPDDNEVPPVVDIPEDLEPIVPPVVDIPEETPVVDITPPIKDDTSSDSGEGLNLGKVMGISLGVGAAVGAAALGAHTVKKAKDNNIYED